MMSDTYKHTNNQQMTNHVLVMAIAATTLAALFYFYDFFVRLMPTTMTEELKLYFTIGNSGLGILGACYFWGYAPMQIPAGLIIDRFGAKRALTIAMALCAICTLIFPLTSIFSVAAGSRFLVGVTTAFAYPGALVLVARLFQAKHFAGITGLIQMSGCVGAMMGVAPIAISVATIGWQNTVYLVGLLGTFLAIVFWIIANKSHDSQSAPSSTADNEWQRLKGVLGRAQTWLIAVYAFAIWGPISVFATFWCVPFLNAHGYTATTAGLLDTLIWLGIALGGPTLGWLSNQITSRRIPMLATCVLAIVSELYIIYTPNFSVLLLALALIIFGVAASGQAVSFGLVQDLNPPKTHGTAFGFNNTAIVAGGVVLTPIVGVILDAFPGYATPTSYAIALSVLPVISVLGLIITASFVRETHCLSQND